MEREQKLCVSFNEKFECKTYREKGSMVCPKCQSTDISLSLSTVGGLSGVINGIPVPSARPAFGALWLLASPLISYIKAKKGNNSEAAEDTVSYFECEKCNLIFLNENQ